MLSGVERRCVQHPPIMTGDRASQPLTDAQVIQAHAGSVVRERVDDAAVGGDMHNPKFSDGSDDIAADVVPAARRGGVTCTD